MRSLTGHSSPSACLPGTGGIDLPVKDPGEAALDSVHALGRESISFQKDRINE